MQRGRAIVGLALIGVAMLIVTGWSPWSWATPWPGSADERHEQLDAGVRTVALDTGSGDVTIRTRDQARTSLTTRVDTWAWTRPDPTHRRDGATLVLTGCGNGCEVDYELVVPRGTAIEGETGSGDVTVVGAAATDVAVGSGDVEVREVPGTVVVDTGSGEIRLADVSGPSTLHTSSGSIRGDLLRGRVEASTSSGDIVLDLARPQHVRAETSSGDVELAVPAGRYQIDDSGGDGRGDIEVTDDPNARYTLELTTSSGDIAVAAR